MSEEQLILAFRGQTWSPKTTVTWLFKPKKVFGKHLFN